MEQLVGLLLLGLISFISWAIQKSAERREAQKKLDRGEELSSELPQPDLPYRPAHAPATESEQAMRRLREALGLPDEDEPLILQRPEPPPVARPLPPPLPQQRPLVVATAPPVVLKRQFRPPALPAAARSIGLLEPDSPRHKMSLPTRRITADAVEFQVSSRVRDLLKAPDGVRDAIILAEILGRPKSLAG